MRKASETTKLTNKSVNDFMKNSDVGQRLYDTEVSGFHIRKLKTGAYFYQYYKNEMGKGRVVPVGKFTDNTCDQARNKAKKYSGQVISGEDILETRKESKRTNAKTGREYLSTSYTTVQKNKKTGYRTIKLIEGFFPELLDKPISELSDDDIIRWQEEQQSTGIKYATVKRRFNAFKAMLNYAAKKKYINSNPIANASLVSYQETEEERAIRKTRRTYLEASQMQKFLETLNKYQEEKRVQRRNSRAHGRSNLPDLDKVEFVDHVNPIMLVMFYTGFRNGDAIGLRWEHVNFDSSLISKVIEKTAHKIDKVQHFPISRPLLDILKKWHSQNGSPANGLVFPSPITGKRLDVSALQTPWKNIRSLAGLPDEMHLYTLRHNFASHLVMQGCNLLSVAKLLGHSDVEMIVEHYGHLQPSHLQDVTAKFAGIVKSDQVNGGVAAKV